MTGFQGILLSLISYIILCLQIHHISAQTYLGFSCNGTIGTYKKNSKFQANLNTIFSSLSSNINTYGFYNGTAGAGDGVEKVNAIALCRGDVEISSCKECVRIAAYNLISTQCPKQKEAVIWYDECMFRYSNNNILGVMLLNPYYSSQNTVDASNVTSFSLELQSFADNLVNKAYKGSFRKYTEKKISHKNEQTVYGFMQCTPDITPRDCKFCLNSIAKELSDCCYIRVGARWITPSCSFRYEIYPFIDNQPPPTRR